MYVDGGVVEGESECGDAGVGSALTVDGGY